MRRLIILLVFAAAALSAAAQSFMPAQAPAGTDIILFPSAYTGQKGQYEFHIEMAPFRTHAAVSLTNRLMLGVSYGGENVIGNEEIDWYPRVEFLIKYNLFEERYAFPAITVGYSSIGWGLFDAAPDRYLIKSRGFYGVASKEISLFGGMVFHGGISYTREAADFEDKDGITLFFGGEKRLNEELSIIGEWDLGLNDNGENCLGDGKGYFNLGARWTFVPELIIDFHLINVFGNFNTDPEDGVAIPAPYNKIGRNISITYRSFF
ncbi:MAG TPA: hypothetical protein ENN72_02885 [Firmicutes bacterium]|nr:hypothetical protein [Bacillota bacterium]